MCISQNCDFHLTPYFSKKCAYVNFVYLLQATDNAVSAYTKAPARNQPWIAAFLDESGSKYSYVVVCEPKKFCRVSALQLALFVTFSLYYVFNLEYPDDAKVFLFLQHYILEQPDRSKKLPRT